jgi:Na+-translocating ferredoxin:NAD+ oxidoreductase RnfA subunit
VEQVELLLRNGHVSLFFHSAFVESTITTACCVCMIALFNGTFLSQCIHAHVDSTTSSSCMRVIVVLLDAQSVSESAGYCRLPDDF